MDPRKHFYVSTLLSMLPVSSVSMAWRDVTIPVVSSQTNTIAERACTNRKWESNLVTSGRCHIILHHAARPNVYIRLVFDKYLLSLWVICFAGYTGLTVYLLLLFSDRRRPHDHQSENVPDLLYNSCRDRHSIFRYLVKSLGDVKMCAGLCHELQDDKSRECALRSAHLISCHMPISHAPSFNPTIYPFQLSFTLSASTPPSILTLPRHQHQEAKFSDLESLRSTQDVKVSRNSRERSGNSSGEEVANH
jgi:hypothetical protein